MMVNMFAAHDKRKTEAKNRVANSFTENTIEYQNQHNLEAIKSITKSNCSLYGTKHSNLSVT
jgi:hypothetical protein